ncbi:BlaI/MecI/CopY family transcriptional regulator [Tunicatimonas pelagia]|uniref:BlaI/MecI/CopY family transcriptional regulator n=1 Tax=Tunicatimonas pelagia TaxID=931531 RepID=UPI002665A258|nr:BlaI/MecI/CopY family transcriptional regulator [Tunicatimonas pelagia]WKN43720.1 BlaI/MecI/CopY family transcriptional regulator [Tunicatimonas pelagia]
MKIPPKPTEAELEILQIVYQLGPTTVRLVHDELAQQRDIGYTTTLKNMQNMVQKGLLVRDESAKSHIYAANVPQEKTQKLLLDRLLETAFGGSAGRMVLQALGHRKTSKEELDQIKELIKKLEGGKS